MMITITSAMSAIAATTIPAIQPTPQARGGEVWAVPPVVIVVTSSVVGAGVEPGESEGSFHYTVRHNCKLYMSVH